MKIILAYQLLFHKRKVEPGMCRETNFSKKMFGSEIQSTLENLHSTVT